METDIEITIEKPRAKINVDSPIEKNIHWYDIFYKKMRTFQCTKLDFKYSEERFVQFPDGSRKPVDETTIAEQDEHGIYAINMLRPSPVTFYKKLSTIKVDDGVKKLLNEYDKYNRSQMQIVGETTDSIIVSIPKKELRDFTDELYRNKFEYEVSG